MRFSYFLKFVTGPVVMGVVTNLRLKKPTRVLLGNDLTNQCCLMRWNTMIIVDTPLAGD